MRLPHDLPGLAVVRVLTGGGPYRVDQTISLAFASPTVGRLVAHGLLPLDAGCIEETAVPETIAVTVVHPADPYELGEVLALSFVDPRVARIHRSEDRSVDPQRRVRSLSASERLDSPMECPQSIDRCADPRLEEQEPEPFERLPGAWQRDADTTVLRASSKSQDGTGNASTLEPHAHEGVEREAFGQSAPDCGNSEQLHERAEFQPQTILDELERRDFEAATAGQRPERETAQSSQLVSRDVLQDPAFQADLAMQQTRIGDRSTEPTSTEHLERPVLGPATIPGRSQGQANWTAAIRVVPPQSPIDEVSAPA